MPTFELHVLHKKLNAYVIHILLTAFSCLSALECEDWKDTARDQWIHWEETWDHIWRRRWWSSCLECVELQLKGKGPTDSSGPREESRRLTFWAWAGSVRTRVNRPRQISSCWGGPLHTWEGRAKAISCYSHVGSASTVSPKILGTLE